MRFVALIAVGALLFLLSAPQFAAGQVPNGSFELPNASGTEGSPDGPPTNWSGAGSVLDPLNSQYAGSTGGSVPSPGSGTQVARLIQGDSLESDALGLLASDTLYTLSVAVGRGLDTVVAPTFSIELLANGSPLSASSTSGTIPSSGTFQLWTLGFGPFSPSNPAVGQTLTVRLSAASVTSNQVDFDNVSLALPEPGSLFLVGLMGGGMLLRRRHAA